MCCVQTTFQKCNTGIRKSFLHERTTCPRRNMNNHHSNSVQQTVLSIAVIALIAVLITSGIHPYDRATWLMEVLPVLIALPILAWSYRRFPLTNLLYFLIFLHALILIGGGT